MSSHETTPIEAALARVRAETADDRQWVNERAWLRLGDVWAMLDEIERLEAKLLRFVQTSNNCIATGKPCREPERCGCALEAEEECPHAL